MLTDPSDVEPYVVDWRGRYRGARARDRAPGRHRRSRGRRRAVRGRARADRSAGRQHRDAAPRRPTSRDAKSSSRSDGCARVRAVDPANATITVEAGVTLAEVQQAAADADLLFPLSLASEGSCTIGGNLSTNAGGTAVLRYGNTRDLVLGVEVVLADGRVWNALRGCARTIPATI